MNPSIYFPFAEYERKIHSKESCYLKWQQENAVYDNRGKICAVPYETAKPYLKTPIDWMWYLIDAPQEYRNCDFSLFSDLELYFLLRERMELTLVTSWHNMKTEYKELLLAYHPELAENIAELQNLSGDHWQKILQIKPEYEIYCPWQKFSGNNWQVILEEHPEFARYCNFSLLSTENWSDLLKKQIRFFPFCPAEIRKNISENDRNELFMLYPEIKENETACSLCGTAAEIGSISEPVDGNAEKYRNILADLHDGSMYYVTSFDEKKLNAAMEFYGKELVRNKQDIIIHRDFSLFGKTAGYILTEYGIAYTKNKGLFKGWDPQVILFDKDTEMIVYDKEREGFEYWYVTLNGEEVLDCFDQRCGKVDPKDELLVNVLQEIIEKK